MNSVLSTCCRRINLGVVCCVVAENPVADPVSDWNSAAREAIRADRTAPPWASRGLAMLHLAIYDAVNGGQRTHRPYHVTDVAPAGASIEAAVSSAAYDVLRHLFPSPGIQATNLNVLYTNLVAAIPAGQAKEDGLRWGSAVAEAIIGLRADDGSTNVPDYVPGTEPGQWRPTLPAYAPALLPGWGAVTPFGMTGGAQFRPQAPPLVTSSAYAFEWSVVKAYGAAEGSLRSADQSEIAEFWSDGAGTETPPGHWNRIAVDVARDRGLSLAENARLLALVNLALADAGICSWDAKYAYDYWRPITAIREADTDGNPETTADPDWSPFVATPPFPEYTSGHSTFSRAAATTLGGFFGSDEIAFSTVSDGLPGVTRSYAGFGAAADESGISRIYGGIHFPSANIAGQTTGHLLGQFVVGNFLWPLKAPTFISVLPGPDGTQVRLLGEPGGVYVLETCPDLSVWTLVETGTSDANGEVVFTDPGTIGSTKGFYRALAR